MCKVLGLSLKTETRNRFFFLGFCCWVYFIYLFIFMRVDENKKQEDFSECVESYYLVTKIFGEVRIGFLCVCIIIFVYCLFF